MIEIRFEEREKSACSIFWRVSMGAAPLARSAFAACGTIPPTNGRSWSWSCTMWSGPPPMRRI